jgi:hypothetical protein
MVVFDHAIAERAETPQFQVPRFHRTLSDWMAIVVGAGLTIRQFGEPMAPEDAARAEPIVEDTRVAPLFLHGLAIKPCDLPPFPFIRFPLG